MFKIIGFVMQIAVLSFSPNLSANASEKLQISLDVFETTIYGHAWDGFAIGLGRGGAYGALPTTSPPDAAVCVVFESKAECYQSGYEDKPSSLCHDSYNCSWIVDIPANGSFGLLFYEIDNLAGKGANDFIDAIIFSRRDGAENEIDQELRILLKSISKLSVTTPNIFASFFPAKTIIIRPGEEKRRVRPFKIIYQGDCKVPCRLQQSQIEVSVVQ